MTFIKTTNRQDKPPASPTLSDLSIIPIPPNNPTIYLLRTSGQVGTPSPTSSHSQVPEDFVQQARYALANVGACLSIHGASPRDITKITIYVVGLDDAKKKDLIQVIPEFFLGPDGRHHKPASTLLGVSTLASPEFLVEIEAEAAVEV